MEQLNFVDQLAEEPFYTVTELTREIKYLLQSHFPHVWIQGEISNFTHHSSGHMYFSLKDENAQISCVMWRSRNHHVFFTPQDGLKVTLKARLSLYEKRGSYQLDVQQMLPAGAGELQIAFEQLKHRLKEEGLFSEQYKKSLPVYPERIGIVTSPTGAAIHDMITILRRRFPAVEIILLPVRVQGEGAASEIAQAIKTFNEYARIDVLIVGRGGGSLEDLWAFNEEKVARAVFASEIPIISAVGHEVDFTICDFVSDVRASTPSAAAELVVPSRDELAASLKNAVQNMTDAVFDRIHYQREKLKTIEGCYAFHQPLDMIRQYSQRLDELQRHLKNLMGHKIDLCHEKLNGMTNRFTLLEHRNVLKRGYSICYRSEDRIIVTKASELKPDETIEVEFFKGNIRGTVDEVRDS
ncbi:MAG: exodeoxyribonuclease VII large subunit [bacterium]